MVHLLPGDPTLKSHSDYCMIELTRSFSPDGAESVLACNADTHVLPKGAGEWIAKIILKHYTGWACTL